MSVFKFLPDGFNSSDYESVKESLSVLNAPIAQNAPTFDQKQQSFISKTRDNLLNLEKMLSKPLDKGEKLGIVIDIKQEYDAISKKNITLIYVDVPNEEFDFISHPDQSVQLQQELQNSKYKVFYPESEILLEKERPSKNDIVRVRMSPVPFMEANFNPQDNKYLGIYSRQKTVLPDLTNAVAQTARKALELINNLFSSNSAKLTEEEITGLENKLFNQVKQNFPDLSNEQAAAIVGSFDFDSLPATTPLDKEKASQLPEKEVVKISELSERFQPIVINILLGLRQNNIEYYLGDAFRSKEESDAKYAAYKAGNGPLAAPGGSSAHNFKEAIDVNLFKKNEKTGKKEFINNINSAEWQTFGRLAKENGAVWGGDWEPKLIDGPHIEHPNWRDVRSGKAIKDNYGIAGWSNSGVYGKRLENLIKFSQSQGLDLSSTDVQISFAFSELNSEVWPGTQTRNSTISEIKKQSSVEAAISSFQKNYDLNIKKSESNRLASALKILANLEKQRTISTNEQQETPRAAETTSQTNNNTAVGGSKPANRPFLLLKKIQTDLASSVSLNKERGANYILVREDIYNDIIQIKSILNNFNIPFSCDFLDVNFNNNNLSVFGKLGLEIRINKNLAVSNSQLLVNKNEFFVGPNYAKPLGNGYELNVYGIVNKTFNTTEIIYEFKNEVLDIYNIKNNFGKSPKLEKTLKSYLNVTKIFEDFGFIHALPKQEFFMNSNPETSNWNVFYKPSKLVKGLSYREALSSLYDIKNNVAIPNLFWDGKRFANGAKIY